MVVSIPRTSAQLPQRGDPEGTKRVTDRPDWASHDVDDLRRPNAARVYDYYLGGGVNFTVDREFARSVLELLPGARQAAQLNRAFMRRAMEFFVANGVRQFLDIGSGIPTVGNVHEVAEALDPGARVVYVDNEPVAVMHARKLLQGNTNVGVVECDLRDAATLLTHDTVRALLDFEQPIAVLLVSILHFVPDSDALTNALYAYQDAVPSGSYFAISQATVDPDPVRIGKAVALYNGSTTPFITRTKAEFSRFFRHLELVDPGVVYTPQWRPDSPDDVGEHPEESLYYAAVARKP